MKNMLFKYNLFIHITVNTGFDSKNNSYICHFLEMRELIWRLYFDYDP